MPQSLAELGAAFLEQERQKEEQKNANSLAKMRMETLTHRAQAAESEQRGAQNVIETIDPLVNMWQAQAAQMRRETAEANQRSALTSRLALSALQEQRSRPTPDVSSAMSDAFSTYKMLKQMEIIEGLQRGEYPSETDLQIFMPSVEHPETAMRKMMTKEAERETADIRALRKSIMLDWDNEMDALAEEARTAEREYPGRGLGEMIEMDRQRLSRRKITLMEQMGIEPPDVMYRAANMVKPQPAPPKPAPKPKKGERLPHLKGKPVYKGRKDITYGTAYAGGQERLQLTPGEKETAIRESYASAVKEVFGDIPDDVTRQLVDELMGGYTRDVSHQRIRTMPFQTRHLRAAGTSPIEAWKRGITEIERRLKK